MLEMFWNNGGEFIVAALVFAFFGSMMLFFGMKEVLLQRKLNKIGIHTKAEVEALHASLQAVERNGRNRVEIRYNLRLKYNYDGHVVHVMDNFSYKKSHINDIEVGDSVNIVYNPKNCKQFMIVDEKIRSNIDNVNFNIMLFIACFAGIGLYAGTIGMLVMGIKELLF